MYADKILRIEKYRKLVARLNKEYQERYGFTHLEDQTIEFSIGKRFARIYFASFGEARSVHSFVDIESGDIVKGSWKAPIRDKSGKLAIRGNINADDVGESSIDHNGTKYLR